MEACALNNLLCYYTEKDVSTKVRGGRYGVLESLFDNIAGLA